MSKIDYFDKLVTVYKHVHNNLEKTMLTGIMTWMAFIGECTQDVYYYNKIEGVIMEAAFV